MLSALLLVTAVVAGADPTPAPAPTTAAPAAKPPSKVRVLVLDFKPSGGVEKDVAENITGLAAAILSEDKRLEVLAGPDLRSMIDLQVQKRETGCNGDNSCVAELAGALDAKLVVIGNVGYLGSELNLNLVLFDQATGANAGRRAFQAKDLSEVSSKLREPLHSLVDDVLGPSNLSVAGGGGGVSTGLIVTIAGGVGAVVGAGLLVVSALPGAAIAADEQKFVESGDAAALADAKDQQKTWYDGNLATICAVSGGALLVAGAGAVVGGIVMGFE